MRDDCSFCKLARHNQFKKALHSELFYEDEHIIIVEDDHNKEYDIRLLAVWKEHIPVGGLETWQKVHMSTCLLDQVRKVKKRGFQLEDLDTEKHTILDHEHWQACMKQAQRG